VKLAFRKPPVCRRAIQFPLQEQAPPEWLGVLEQLTQFTLRPHNLVKRFGIKPELCGRKHNSGFEFTENNVMKTSGWLTMSGACGPQAVKAKPHEERGAESGAPCSRLALLTSGPHQPRSLSGP